MREQRKKYVPWLDSDDVVVVANAMLIMIGRALNMLKRQREAQGQAFEKRGGFSERLTAKRIEAREKDQPASPECPLCAKPMRPRKSAKGAFWGCSAFPECKGTRPYAVVDPTDRIDRKDNGVNKVNPVKNETLPP